MNRLWRILSAIVVGLTATVVAAAPAHATTVEFQKVTEWGTGYIVQATVTNDFDFPISGWEVAFYLPPGEEVMNVWNVQVGRDTPHYVYVNALWNGALDPGASAEFGFIVTSTRDSTGEPVILYP
jgi:cellulase/cellobiase CelA1